MSELNFKKLAEAELVDSAPEGAAALAEAGGKIIRVTGGIGGGAGNFIFDFTKYYAGVQDGSVDGTITDSMLSVTTTSDEVKDLMRAAYEGQAITILVDVGAMDGGILRCYATSEIILAGVEDGDSIVYGIANGAFLFGVKVEIGGSEAVLAVNLDAVEL